MTFTKCKICREPFFSYGSNLCPACQEQIDKDFLIVRDYIYDHPHNSSVEKIAEETGVKEKHIMRLLEEGRLTAQGIGGVNSSGLRCQICGRPIERGTLCESCKSSLTRELGSAANAIPQKNTNASGYVSPRSARLTEIEHSKK